MYMLIAVHFHVSPDKMMGLMAAICYLMFGVRDLIETDLRVGAAHLASTNQTIPGYRERRDRRGRESRYNKIHSQTEAEYLTCERATKIDVHDVINKARAINTTELTRETKFPLPVPALAALSKLKLEYMPMVEGVLLLGGLCGIAFRDSIKSFYRMPAKLDRCMGEYRDLLRNICSNVTSPTAQFLSMADLTKQERGGGGAAIAAATVPKAKKRGAAKKPTTEQEGGAVGAALTVATHLPEATKRKSPKKRKKRSPKGQRASGAVDGAHLAVD
ncbi:hypothetical protein B484DRAFT_401630 [Ochromonadaceae sp. CCMP2298]|nr:hypothetical protein B484DRAFT_401630 [Ochromonadaceae sp. CCMP2298]